MECSVMTMTTPRDLFIHELSDAMSAEQQILKMLPEWQKESQQPQVKQALQQHEQETRQQAQNIQTIFTQLGEKPQGTTCFAVQGIGEEHKAIRKAKPSAEVLELANLDCTAKTEHYEMAMYGGLVQMANDLGERQAAQLLQQNLDQETAMAKRIELLARDVGRQTATSANRAMA
jgi:ferritin-like metal-binding protein YciE